MESSEISTSPRKKLKVEHHTSVDPIIMHQSIIPPIEDMADPLADHSSSEKLNQEARCGITELVNPELVGFTGILKKRYTDFLVNEILPSGVVVHLDNLKGPRKGKQIGQHDEAKPTSPIAIGKDAEQHPNGSVEHESKDDVTSSPPKSASVELDTSSHVVKQPPEHLPPHLRASLQAPMERYEPVNTAPQCRTKHKDLLRETITGLVVIDPKDEAEPPVESSVTVSLSDPEKDAAVSEQLTSKADEVARLGDEIENGKSKQPHQEPVSTSAADWQAYANVPRGFQLAAEDKDLLLSFFDAETVESTIALYKRIVDSPLRKAKDYGTVKSAPITDRDMRTKIHHAIRTVFGSRLETSTDENGAMLIYAMPQKSDWTARAPANSNNRGKSSHQKGRLGWQDLGGEYLHFTLYKENKDTMEVISYLAKSLKMKPQSFQFAGTKDRRGVTVQRVSVFRVFADRMIGVGHTLRNAKIGNFEYQPSGLQLGQLAGNEFVITLRNCQFGDDVDPQDRVSHASQIVGCAIQNLKQNGFLNYYGLQRFGTFSTRTDTVGIKMLQGDFQAAVEAILDYSPSSLAAAQDPTLDHENISADDKGRAYALNIFQNTRKAHPALKYLPRKFSAEASIIRHLGNGDRGRDFHGALQTISRNLRLMYVHAYQSLVWNVAASERWKLFGPRVVEGDLVLIEQHNDKLEDTVQPDGIDADGEVIIQPGEDDRALNSVDIFTRARALTQDEANSDKYTIFDIILPTPGYDILYPANEMLDVYKEFMASERGGGLDPLDMRRKWKDVNLSGSYRKLLARPGEDISFEIKTYQDENEQFVQTDLDRLLPGGQQPPPPKDRQKMTNLSGAHDDDAKGDDWQAIQEHLNARKQELEERSAVEPTTEEEKIAVILKLQLGSSQYATMALRELMKAAGVQTYKPDYGGGR